MCFFNRVIGLVLVLVMVVACGGGSSDSTNDAGAVMNDPPSDTAGASDAGESDAGESDAGASDAGASDAGASDAGASDAGSEAPTTSEISSLVATPEMQVVGTPVTFTWEAIISSDTIDCRLDFDADSAGGLSPLLDDCESGSFSHTYDLPGTYTVTLSLTRPNVLLRSESISVVIEPVNTPPQIEQFSSVEAPVMVNEPVLFEWSILDADGDTLSCALDVDGDGIDDYTIDSCSNDNSITHHYLAPGDYSPRLTVVDPFDEAVFELVDVHVLPIMVTIHAASPVVSGTRARFDVRISNVSTAAINNVSVLHRLPAALSFNYRNDAFPDASGCFGCVAESEASWGYRSMAAGESRFISVNALVASDLINGDIVSAPFIVSADGMKAPIQIEKSIAINNRPISMVELSSLSTSVLPNEQFDLTASIGNISSADLPVSQVSLSIPPGVEFVNVESSDGSYNEDERVVTWALDEVPLLQSISRTVTLRPIVEAVDGTVMPYHLSVLHGEELYSNELSVPVVTSLPSIDVNVSPLLNPVESDSRYQFHVTVSNRSLIPVNDVGIMYRVPPGFSHNYRDDASPNMTGCFSCEQGAESYWVVGTLQSGESHTLTVNSDVSDLIQGGSIRTLPITAYADGMDLTVFRKVVSRIDFSSKVETAAFASKYLVSGGEEFDVSVDVGNVQSAAVNAGQLMMEIPTEFTVGAVSHDGTFDANTRVVSWNSINLGVSETRRYSATLTANTDVNAGESHVFSTTFDLVDTVQVDASSVATVAITDVQSPLELTISTIDSHASPGNRLRYQFEIKNNGLIPMKDVSLWYRVPDGLTFNYRNDATPDAGGCFSCVEGSESGWSFDSIDVGASVSIELNASVASTLKPGSILSAPIGLRGENLPNMHFRVHSIGVK